MNKNTILAGLIIIFMIGGAVWYYQSYNSMQNNTKTDALSRLIADIATNQGSFTIELYSEDAPKTVENFRKLAKAKFYDGLTFHRIVRNFVIQGGDPNCTSGRGNGPCGAGGPGYQFEDELNPMTKSYQEGYKKGIVAMANAGPNTNGSQFFIMLADTSLPHQYSIFGKVIFGQEVVDAIGQVPIDQERPSNPVIINTITIRNQ